MALALLGQLAGRAQTENVNLIRTAPYPAYREPERMRYNLKWGKAIGRFRASLQTEYNDNLTLSERNAESDLLFEPIVGVGFLLPLSKANILQLDLDAGYQSYLSHPELNTLTIAPNSRIDYRVIVNKVAVTFHDMFTIQSDPISRPELGGASAGNASEFRRLNNVTGVLADWRFTKQLGLLAGYDYLIDRALSGEFQSLDRDDHTFSGGIYDVLSPRWTVGLNGAYSFSEYLQPTHNNSTSQSVGPFVTWQPSHFLTVDAGVSYSVTTFDRSGSIVDQTDFSGMTFQISAKHRLNSRMTQSLHLSKGTQQGFLSNFTEIFVAQHNFSARVSRAATLSTGMTYEDFAASGGGGEAGYRVLLNIGAAYKVLKNWDLGLNYAWALKDSNAPGNDYLQNRVGLNVTRNF